MQVHRFEVSSTLPLPATRFWDYATLADVNRELAPWVQMTAPVSWKDVPFREWPAGKPLFRSWILLFGFLPIDLHSFFLHAVHPESGFEERSTSLMNKRWWHTRLVEPNPGGCLVSDVVQFESRLPFMGTLLVPIYRAIFRSRHRTLRRKYRQNDG